MLPKRDLQKNGKRNGKQVLEGLGIKPTRDIRCSSGLLNAPPLSCQVLLRVIKPAMPGHAYTAVRIASQPRSKRNARSARPHVVLLIFFSFSFLFTSYLGPSIPPDNKNDY